MRDIDLNEVLSIRAQESPPAPDETPPHPDLNEVLSIRAQESARVFLEFRVVRTSMKS